VHDDPRVDDPPELENPEQDQHQHRRQQREFDGRVGALPPPST